jgi:hypothetical protein
MAPPKRMMREGENCEVPGSAPRVRSFWMP